MGNARFYELGLKARDSYLEVGELSRSYLNVNRRDNPRVNS